MAKRRPSGRVIKSARFDTDTLLDSGFLLPNANRQQFRRTVCDFAATRQGQRYAQAIQRDVNPIEAQHMMRVVHTETPAGTGLMAIVAIPKDTPIIAVKGLVFPAKVILRELWQEYTWWTGRRSSPYMICQWDTGFSNEARYINAPSEGEVANVIGEWICGEKMLVITASKDIKKDTWMLMKYPFKKKARYGDSSCCSHSPCQSPCHSPCSHSLCVSVHACMLGSMPISASTAMQPHFACASCQLCMCRICLWHERSILTHPVLVCGSLVQDKDAEEAGI
jgi:hypothetical protein